MHIHVYIYIYTQRYGTVLTSSVNGSKNARSATGLTARPYQSVGCQCLELVSSTRLCSYVRFQGRVRWNWDALRPSAASGSQQANSETKAAQDT